MKFADYFDAMDTSGGKYSAYKIPKWDFHTADILEMMDEDTPEDYE